jgi:alpha-glucan,water dikinase
VADFVSLGDGVSVAPVQQDDRLTLTIGVQASSDCLLHWGLTRHAGGAWSRPPEANWPAGTTPFDDHAVRTPLAPHGSDQREVTIQLSLPSPDRELVFALYFPQENRWLNHGGKNYSLPLPLQQPADPRLASTRLADLAERIIAAETEAGSWTLMHRFNLCHDLLAGVDEDADALALLFAWLRYSALRQLDWQRNYNTKPRELAVAQDRLTTRLAGIWRRLGPQAKARPWARLLLTTLGRGGEGQRVRDEILHIMHRNNMKEVSGSFLEEWHQKLHNNTTPDDVVICTAYLAFLQSDGHLEAFNQALQAGGVTRERLQSFERPIKTDPTFAADKKEALIKEFENFLRILKSVHAGTDLESATDAAGSRLNEELNKQLHEVLALRQQEGALERAAPRIVSARNQLKAILAAAQDDAAARDLLFLDLALEENLRGLIEQQNFRELPRDRLVPLTGWALQNLGLSIDSPELAVCAGHWSKLIGGPSAGKDWALHAKSVTDRAARWVQGFTQDLFERLQSKAQLLGEAFKAEVWTIPLFSEEVIRGGPAFALSLVLRPLDRLLRQDAGLGGWQVISPAEAAGTVRVVDRLLAVQGQRYPDATVLVADAVAGNEEIPEGVTAVVTSDAPDLVSHVSVRARNAHVLFATCFESSTYEDLKGYQDKYVALRVTPGGDVDYAEANPRAGSPKAQAEEKPKAQGPVRPGAPGADVPWVITHDQFTQEIVGGKSNNLNGLRGRLGDWIHLPTSIALPFGAFEKALQDNSNRAVRQEYDGLVAQVEQDPAKVLPRLRAVVQKMASPTALKDALLQTWQRAGLAAVDWEKAWTAIRRVWASKWNDRAYWSRRARGIPHDSLLMAVLGQQVVKADYAYVIHTTNPMTANPEELYAEVVLGLGETLVGNYPGRALGFVCRKTDLNPQIHSYPGKSVGLYSKGVIFRSDSNGEDLAEFAGAGLYDSFLADEPERRLLDYGNEPLVWDEKFRSELLRSIARAGLEVEKALGSPQDIEGAVAAGQCYVVQTRPQVGLVKN